MSVLRTRVIGPVMLPNGAAAPDGSKIIFTLLSWDKTDDSVVLGGPVEAIVSDGAINQLLHRTMTGDRQTAYRVDYTYFNAATRRWESGNLSQGIQLTGSADVELADLLAVPAYVPTLPDALAQALAAAASATAAAANANADAIAAANSASAAALYDGHWLDDIAALQADTVLTYSGTGAGRVDPGDYVMTRKENAVFRVVASGATDHSLATSRPTNPVKFAVQYWPQDDRGALAEIGYRAQNGEAVAIAGYGDSTVLGVDDVTELFNNWPNRLGSVLRSISGNEGIATYNCGSGGKKIIDYWARDNYVAEVIGARPATEYVFIGFGLNDIKATLPGWDTALFRQRYAELIWQVRLSGRTPVMVAPITISAEPIRPVPLIQGELMNVTRQIATEHMVALLDVNAMLQSWQVNRADQYRIGDYQTDGTHPSDDVYVIIAQFMAREIFRSRVIDIKHGSRVGPGDAEYASDVTVTYNYLMNNNWGMSAQLAATGNVNQAAWVYVWSDKLRRAVYVSPDQSVVTGSNPAYAYVDWLAHPSIQGVEINFGAAAAATTNRPAESHIFVGDIPFGLSRLRFRASGAGTVEFGGFLTVDNYETVSVSAYSVAASPSKDVFLPANWQASPAIVPKYSASTNILLDANIPVGWGVVIATQYVFDDATDRGPARRRMSIVAMRLASSVDILEVLHDNSGVISATSIKTSATGAWAGQMSAHFVITSGNPLIQIRSDGTVVAVHTGGSGTPFKSGYGHLGGLYRDAALVTDPVGRQAYATLIVHDRAL